MKLHEKQIGVIERLDRNGRGVIESVNKPIVVNNTCPGDRVEIETKRRAKGVIEADLLNLIEPSPHRVQPKCPHADRCGGCKWQHLAYNFQTEQKLNLINRSLNEFGLTSRVDEIVRCPEPFYYRNRMDYSFGPNGELGLKEPGRWWAPIDLETCFLLSKDTVEIIHRVRDWAKTTGLPFWNAKEHTGFFRNLVIREGKNTNERMVMLLTVEEQGTRNKVQELETLLGELATSIVWGINSRVADVSIPERIETIMGDSWIHEEVNGFRYRIHPGSFFQTNSIMAAKLQDTVSDFCGDLSGKTLLDLYCGSGFFSIALADNCQQAIGIELDEFGIANAKANATLNAIDNVEYYVSKAEDYDWIGHAPDVVILDPPRAGLHPKVLKTLSLALPKKIVYVSCNYHRFAEELPLLLNHYQINRMRALDLFPHTPHVELVTELSLL